MLTGRRILLAVTGGIAAYKACELVRLLLKQGAAVQVAMTQAAIHFVGPTTFEALTGRRVAIDMFSLEEQGQGHLDLARECDLMVIAPATANCLSKLAQGLADDLVSTTALALKAPPVLCPAMNTRMYEHPAVQENLQKLMKRGAVIIDPEKGPLAHPSEEPGWGRLADPAAILDRICRLLPPAGSLSGKTITITAGPTREALDPVRFLSNYSSGAMGYALAGEARRRGALVQLISGPVNLTPPPGLDVLHVENTAEMRSAVLEACKTSQALIMAAAPADFEPEQFSPKKIKKGSLGDSITLPLRKTPDILKELSATKGQKILIGFALETDDSLDHAKTKLSTKHLDLVVLNHPHPQEGAGMGRAAIKATLLEPQGLPEEFPAMRKTQMAGIILDRLENLLKNRQI